MLHALCAGQAAKTNLQQSLVQKRESREKLLALRKEFWSLSEDILKEADTLSVFSNKSLTESLASSFISGAVTDSSSDAGPKAPVPTRSKKLTFSENLPSPRNHTLSSKPLQTESQLRSEIKELRTNLQRTVDSLITLSEASCDGGRGQGSVSWSSILSRSGAAQIPKENEMKTPSVARASSDILQKMVAARGKLQESLVIRQQSQEMLTNLRLEFASLSQDVLREAANYRRGPGGQGGHPSLKRELY